MIPRVRRWVPVILVFAVAAGAVAGIWTIERRGPEALAPPPRPNIVFILTDDQRWDALSSMPNVERELVAHGVTFDDAVVDDPLCCPSRSSFLTGQYVSHTGVWENGPPQGGYPGFRDGSTVATWLHAAGYRTALFGKYLNRYTGTRVPPGWDRFGAFVGSGASFYDNYRFGVDGSITLHGDAPADYSTTVISDMALSFLDQTRQRFFLYLAPYAPHEPNTPSPQDRGTFRTVPPWRPGPGYFEPDVTDKPTWVRRLPPRTPGRDASIGALRRRTYQTLAAVDRMVGRVVEELRRTGRLADTMIVFASDNGYSWGEHRWVNKLAPYEESIRIPLIVRYDPWTATPRHDDHLVGNIDLAPTFAQMAGAASRGTDGRSLVRLLRPSGSPLRWREAFLVESIHGGRMPSYCELRTTRYAYIVYARGISELYDLRLDPYELRNLALDPSTDALRASLLAELARLCDPPPPGFASFPPTGGPAPDTSSSG